MAWTPGIPEETNQVRSASGDLVLIKGNFATLSGVATLGIPGVSGVVITTPVSGDSLVWDGINWLNSGVVHALNDLTDVNTAGLVSGDALTYDGSGWVAATPATALDDLTDVATAGVITGDSLVYDGAGWVPSGITAAASAETNRVVLHLSGAFAADQAADALKTVTLDEQLLNDGSWTVNLTSGQIEIPDGVTRVNILGQVVFDDYTNTDLYTGEICVNEATLSGSDLGIRSLQTVRGASSTPAPITSNVSAHGLGVASGDLISIGCRKTEATSRALVSGVRVTWLYVEDATSGAGGGGGGGGGSGFADPVKVFMPDAPPKITHPMNDEFDHVDSDDGGPGDIDSRWAIWDPVAVVHPSLVSGANLLDIQYDTETRWGGVYQLISGVGATASGTNWTAFAKVSWIMRQGSGDDASFGFFSFEDVGGDPGNTNFTGIWVDVPATQPPDIDIGVGEFSDRTDTVPPLTSPETMVIDDLTNGVYLRLRHQADNRHNFEWSTDGVGWRSFAVSIVPSWNPDAIGFAGIKTAGSTTALRVHWFRVVSGSSNRLATVPGAKVQLERLE